MTSAVSSGVGTRWDARVKHESRGCLAWYGPWIDERFWYEHWRERLSDDYYTSARTHNLARHEMGRILLDNIVLEGPHLEAGCGAGYWVAALEQHGFNVEGIESSDALVDLVKKMAPGLPVRQCNALAIDVPNGHYCSYLSFGVVEHRREGPEPFLVEAFRVLREGGRILLSSPYFGPIRRLKARLGCYERNAPDLPFFQYGWTERDLGSAVAAAGFRILAYHRLFVHRLLAEESHAYRYLAHGRGARFVRTAAQTLLGQRDGHMLMIVGEKPER